MRVFVSYSSHDRPSVAALVEQLTAAGFEVWFDQNVSGGQQWWNVILEQLRRCDAVVAIVTPASVSSVACRSEIGYAEALGKTIIPVRLGEVDPAEAPSDLQERQWIDLREPTVAGTLALVKAVNQATVVPLPDPLPDAPVVPLSYQTQVTDRIYSDTTLTLDQQVGVVFGLRHLMATGHDTANVLTLAAQFRQRPDLLAAVVPDADAVLAAARAASRSEAALPPPPPPEPKRDHPGHPRSPLVYVGATLAAVLVVLVIVGLANRGDDGGGASPDTTVADTQPVDTEVTDTLGLGLTETTEAADTTEGSPDETFDVEVAGTQSWTDTGIDVTEGEFVVIDASGEVIHNLDDPVPVGPDGDDREDLRQFNVLPDVNHSALIAEVDDTGPFLVGSHGEITIEHTGRLYLGPNDVGTENNDGAFFATITVQRG